MSKADNKKAKLLGKSFGASSGQLRKALLFKFAGQLGLTDCYRCGIEIDDIAEFSIEHKEPWGSAKNPVEAFFDLDNIAFSHLKCNYGAVNRNKTHCPKSHAYTEANTQIWNGGRWCRQCVSARDATRHQTRDRDKQRKYNREYARRQGTDSGEDGLNHSGDNCSHHICIRGPKGAKGKPGLVAKR